MKLLPNFLQDGLSSYFSQTSCELEWGVLSWCVFQEEAVKMYVKT